MTIKKRGIDFEYFTENSEQFTKDFTHFVSTDIPLFALQDELLYLMHQKGQDYFKIPGTKTVDSNDHFFHFEVYAVEENKSLKIYRYVGMDKLKQK